MVWRPPYTSDAAHVFAEKLEIDHGLSARTARVLQEKDVTGPDSLRALTEQEVLRHRGMGPKTWREIERLQYILSPEGFLDARLRAVNQLLDQAMFSIEMNPEITLEIRWVNGLVPSVRAIASAEGHAYRAPSGPVPEAFRDEGVSGNAEGVSGNTDAGELIESETL